MSWSPDDDEPRYARRSVTYGQCAENCCRWSRPLCDPPEPEGEDDALD